MVFSNYIKESSATPRRYFTLGLISCSLGGLIFSIGIILVVLGSSPDEAEALWICGIVFLLLGAGMFFFGISSIGIYLAKEDQRRRDEERAATRQYAESLRASSQITLT